MADTEHLDLPDECERLLRQELAVEPSPVFAARVRARLDAHRQPACWRWLPAAGALATASALAVAVAVPPVARWTATTLPPSPAAPTEHIATVHRPQAKLAPIAPRAAPSTKTTPRLVRADPEVIVDGRQRAALSMLFRMMDQGRVDRESFAGTVVVSLEPIVAQLEAITVPPVVVNGIVPGGVLPNDNERQPGRPAR